MSRLDDYRTAMLAANPDVSVEALNQQLDECEPEFVTIVVDHGLGPLWHSRTGRGEFHESRMTAEALYLAQQRALEEIDAVLHGAGVEYAVIKGAANRALVYNNPAVRACYDLDLLVRPDDRVRTAAALIEANFVTRPKARNISHELVLSRNRVDIDLHWGLLREGRLRHDPTGDLIDRRRREKGIWMLSADDALFVLLVHPAFAKHLAGWDMGLHRVADIVTWLQTQSINWQAVLDRLQQNGVQSAAWATLRWVQLLAHPHLHVELDTMMSEVSPGPLRRAWLNRWLEKDLSARTSSAHWLRLLGFSLFLHDAPRDSVRALSGRWRAHQRAAADLAAFENLLGQ